MTLSEDEPSCGQPGGTYEWFAGWRPMIITVAVWLTATVAVLVFKSTENGGPPWSFTVLMLGAYAWTVPQALLRFVGRLELRDGIVRWKTAARSGEFPVNDLRSLRPYVWGRNAEVLKIRNGPKLFVFIMRGFAEFAADLSESAPFAQIDVSRRFAAIAERWPGSKNYYRRDH